MGIVSLHDHRVISIKKSTVYCSCGDMFVGTRDFYLHQREWLNHQLKEHGIEVT